MKVIWTLPSKYRLREIFLFYKHKASLRTAKKITFNILIATHILRRQPRIGTKEELLKHKKGEFRYLVEGNYKIIYKIEKNIFILDVFDCRQNPDKMLRNE